MASWRQRYPLEEHCADGMVTDAVPVELKLAAAAKACCLSTLDDIEISAIFRVSAPEAMSTSDNFMVYS